MIGRRCEELSFAEIDADGEPWLSAFTHQCGGYACLQQPIIGIVLPLAWNSCRFARVHVVAAHSSSNCDAGKSAADVVVGLDALSADSPSRAREVHLPYELSSLHLTAGQPYHRGQLDALERFTSRAFTLPGPVRGVEAFVELAECDAIKTFAGWHALSIHARRVDRPSTDRHADVAEAIERWDGVTMFDQTRCERLARRLHALGPPLSTFLVWDNSD